MSLTIAKFMKKYINLTKIGEGGFGEVYAAEELKTRKQVVIKMVPIRNKHELEAYKHETKIYKKLDHHNICRLFKSKMIKSEKGCFGMYILEKMDFDLLSYILLDEKLTEEKSKMIFKEICKAVEYCHANGVAHLDIKSDNVLLTEDEDGEITTVKLCDFGFTRKWDVKKNPNSSYFLTTTERLGTKEYSAPETLNLKVAAVISLEKADIYALGVLLFTMVCGTFPKSYGEDGLLQNSLGFDIVKSVTEGDHCYDLVKQLMNDKPELRPTMREVLNHPWFH